MVALAHPIELILTKDGKRCSRLVRKFNRLFSARVSPPLRLSDGSCRRFRLGRATVIQAEAAN